MVWINGENFLTLKREGLLHGPFAETLPNYRWVDTQGKPTTRIDFSEPVDGLEAPWGMAQFTSTPTARGCRNHPAAWRLCWSSRAGTRGASPIPGRRTSTAPAS